jgi:hypothetical protein
MSYRTPEPHNGFATVCVTMTQLWNGSGSLNKMPVGDQLINLRVTNDTSVTNQIKEMARRSELYLLRRADGIYSPI